MINFGTDGWRGIISNDFTFNNVEVVAQAVADYVNSRVDLFGEIKQLSNQKLDEIPKPNHLITQSLNHSVVVGYDTRFLSEEFAKSSSRVLSSNGLDVIMSETPVTTPALSSAIVDKNANFGLMITASHNPYRFNGIKFKEYYGGPITEETVKEIKNFLYKTPIKKEGETEIKKEDFISDYFKRVKNFVNFSMIKKTSIKIIADPLYGASAGYLEKILDNTKCKIRTIHNYRNPLFGGLNPEPIFHNLSELIKEVKKNRVDVGLSCDGDGDRLGVVDETGIYLAPHQIFPLLLLYFIEEKKIKRENYSDDISQLFDRKNCKVL